MALSMDEQRMLAEIERRLADEDPGLAARLSSFKRPSTAVKFRSPRSMVLGTIFAVAAAVVISMMIYAMVPFRAHVPQDITSPSASGNASVSGTAKPGSGHSSAPKPNISTVAHSAAVTAAP